MSIVFGFALACLVLVGGFVGLLSITGDSAPAVRTQVLPSGTTIQVMSFNLAWGTVHGERHPEQDGFALDYVSSASTADHQAQDQEAREVFELIRPGSEQWGFTRATVSAFPPAKRKGRYIIFAFARSGEG